VTRTEKTTIDGNGVKTTEVTEETEDQPLINNNSNRQYVRGGMFDDSDDDIFAKPKRQLK
jgi:hypothetical protein